MIILADAPTSILKRSLAGLPAKQWIYLGQDDRLNAIFRNILPSSAEEINYAKILYATSDEQRLAFVEWIDQISSNGAPSHEWLFSVPAVKNPASSNLFLNVCYFFVFKKILEKGKRPDVVIVESPALARVLQKYFSTRAHPLNGLGRCITAARVVKKSFLRWGKYALEFRNALSSAKSVFKDRARQFLKDKTSIVFIRNYITGSFTDSDQDIIEKRYYPGLYAFLEKNGKTPVFLPIAVQVKSYRDLFSRVNKSGKRILFVEEFLRWSDYVHLVLTPVRAMFYHIKAPAFQEHDLSVLVKEEYRNNLTEHGLFLAVWCAPLGRRLRQAGIVPEGIINWAEYQSFEKGLIAGLRDSFSSIHVTAAHPFCIPPNHLSLIPSRQDAILKVVPDRSLVLGSLGKSIISQYLGKDHMRTELTPLFRYGSVYQTADDQSEQRDILALFGFSFTNALYTLNMLLQMADRLPFYKNILIKLHPLANFNDQTLIRALGRPLPPRFRFISGNLEDHLKTVAVGICGATGTSVELAVRGIQVVIAAETQALTMNYLAYREDPDLWQICFNADELVRTLEHFQKLKQQDPSRIKQRALEYREVYFSPPQDDLFRNFL